MSQIRVDQIGVQNRVNEGHLVIERKKRLHLFEGSKLETKRKSFSGIGDVDLSSLKAGTDNNGQKKAQAQAEADAVISVRTKSGDVIELPRQNAEDKARVNQIMGSLKPDARSAMRMATAELGDKLYNEIINSNPEGEQPYGLEVTQAAQGVNEEYILFDAQGKEGDAQNDLIILGVWGAEKNVHEFFAEIQEKQAIAGDVRTDIAELEAALLDWPDDGSLETFDYSEVVTNEDGSISVIEHVGVELTKAEAEALLGHLNASESSLATLETMDMNRLQMMVYKWKQAQEVVSNIFKSQDDTRKGIIGNMKA